MAFFYCIRYLDDALVSIGHDSKRGFESQLWQHPFRGIAWRCLSFIEAKRQNSEKRSIGYENSVSQALQCSLLCPGLVPPNSLHEWPPE